VLTLEQPDQAIDLLLAETTLATLVGRPRGRRSDDRRLRGFAERLTEVIAARQLATSKGGSLIPPRSAIKNASCMRRQDQTSGRERRSYAVAWVFPAR
jgi:hypothetical protein